MGSNPIALTNKTNELAENFGRLTRRNSNRMITRVPTIKAKLRSRDLVSPAERQ